MPIVPLPTNELPPPDKWADATFYDATLVQMVTALISSGRYTPGPLVMELAVAATAQIMIETRRWTAPTTDYTLEQAMRNFLRWSGPTR